MALPTRFRDPLCASLNARIVITIDMAERCLLMYPLSEWEVVQQRLEALSNVSSRNRTLQRLLIGHATDVELDGSGRLLVPPMLRDYAELKKKVVCVGQGNKIELWDERCWQARREAWLADETLRDFQDSDGVEELSF